MLLSDGYLNGKAVIWTQACPSPTHPSVILNCFFSSEQKLVCDPLLFDFVPLVSFSGNVRGIPSDEKKGTCQKNA